VPVSLCRALGADVVIAINLNNELSPLGRPAVRATPVTIQTPAPEPVAATGDATSPAFSTLTAQIASWLGRRPGPRTRFLANQLEHTAAPIPNVMEVMAGSIDIMQDRITRSRLAGEPPDVLIAPRLAHIGILEFDRAEEVVEIGYAAASVCRPAIELALRRA